MFEPGYWDWNLVTGEVTFSPRFGELFQLACEGPLPVEDLFAALDDPELEALHTAFADLFARRVERLHEEFQVRTPDSEPMWLRETEVGRGTTFVVRFPTAAGSQQAA